MENLYSCNCASYLPGVPGMPEGPRSPFGPGTPPGPGDPRPPLLPGKPEVPGRPESPLSPEGPGRPGTPRTCIYTTSQKQQCSTLVLGRTLEMFTDFSHLWHRAQLHTGKIQQWLLPDTDELRQRLISESMSGCQTLITVHRRLVKLLPHFPRILQSVSIRDLELLGTQIR